MNNTVVSYHSKGIFSKSQSLHTDNSVEIILKNTMLQKGIVNKTHHHPPPYGYDVWHYVINQHPSFTQSRAQFYKWLPTKCKNKDLMIFSTHLRIKYTIRAGNKIYIQILIIVLSIAVTNKSNMRN